jgi:hypothetical protein
LFLVARAGGGENATLSVLSRVQTVDDPELGELILVAIENHPRIGEKETLEMVCKVTQGYAQIKLLDQQIEQVARRTKAATGPAEVQYELVLAKAELESKRTADLASLRELMGIIPRHAFGARKVSDLTTFVDLDVVGGRVYVLERMEHFIGDSLRDKFRPIGVLSKKEVLEYAKGRFEDKDRLPLRIDIHRTVEEVKLSDELHSALVDLARQTKVQMEAEVHLGAVRQGRGEFVLTLTPGTPPRIDGVHMVDGRPTLSLVDGRRASPQPVDPNNVEAFVTQWLAKPDYLPTRFRLVYPAPMQKLAEATAKTVTSVANGMRLGDFVEVAQSVVEPEAETLYLGRWRATTKGEIQGIDIQRGNRCQLTVVTGSDPAEAATQVPGRWSLTGRQIRIERDPYVYQAYVNTEGNLLLSQRRIGSQGDVMANVAEEPLAFRRAE